MGAEKQAAQSVFFRHYDLPSNFPVVALMGDSWVITHEPVTRMHFHNCFELGFLYEGEGSLHTSDAVIPIKTPAVIVVPPNLPHMMQADAGCVCRWNWIYVDPVQMLPGLSPRLANDLNRYQHTLCGVDCVIDGTEHQRIYTIVKLILEEMNGMGSYYQQAVRDLFGALFMLLLRIKPVEAGLPNVKNQRIGSITPAVNYIAENYMNDVTVDVLAQLCHISTSHFRRLFKQTLGWAPQEYLQIVRIEHACELLYNGDLSITEIGIRVGYPSTSSFSRQFNRLHGISPGRWRQKARSEENPAVTEYLTMLPDTEYEAD